MNYELETISVLTRETLHPSVLQKAKLTADICDQLVQAFQTEKERMYKAFLKASYECKKERVFRMYISHHQHNLIHYSDIIYSYQSSVKDISILSLYQQCMRILEEQLLSMRSCFENSFDERACVTAYYSEVSKTEIRKKANSLRKHLFSLIKNEILCSLILESFEAYLHERNHCTYHHYHYLTVLYNELLKTKNEKEILQCLIVLNFNSPGFLNWYISYLQQVLYQGDQEETVLYRLAVMIKEQQQQFEKNKMAYTPEEISVKTLVCNWLNEEMGCLQMQEAPALYQKSNNNKRKVKLNLSVESMGYFLYLFEKSGLIEAAVKKDIFELVAAHCSSMGQPNIASRSLQNNSYEVSHYTKKKTKELLIKMLNEVNKTIHFLWAYVLLINSFSVENLQVLFDTDVPV